MLTVIKVATLIFLIMNPAGDIPNFLGILSPFKASKQRFIIMREALIALVTLGLFALWGENIFHFMGISENTVAISGGIILFMIAIHMIFPIPGASDKKKVAPFIVPLAIPIIAGPETMSALTIYSHQLPNKADLIFALILAWTCSTIIYMSASFIGGLIGNRGAKALEKLGGIILTMVSIQMISDGVVKLLK